MASYHLPEDIYYRIDNTKPVKSGMYDPYFDEGDHECDVIAIEPFAHPDHGPSVRATFLVIASNTLRAGERRAQTWNLVKAPNFPGGETDADRFADFVRKLKGAPMSHPIGQDIRVVMKSRNEGGRLEDQVARGMRIKCVARNKAKAGKKPFVMPSWMTVEQTPQDIQTRRAAIEANPAAMSLPGTSGGAQAGGYQPTPQTAVQPQYAPPTYQAGFNQQPMAPAPAAQPAPQQQGGFLANLPPMGPGAGSPNGGNNGGGFGGSW